MTVVDSVHLEQFHPSKGTTIYLIDYDLLGTGQVLILILKQGFIAEFYKKTITPLWNPVAATEVAHERYLKFKSIFKSKEWKLETY